MAKSNKPLRFEELEHRWNLAPLLPLIDVAPPQLFEDLSAAINGPRRPQDSGTCDPEIAEVGEQISDIVNLNFASGDPTDNTATLLDEDLLFSPDSVKEFIKENTTVEQTISMDDSPSLGIDNLPEYKQADAAIDEAMGMFPRMETSDDS